MRGFQAPKENPTLNMGSRGFISDDDADDLVSGFTKSYDYPSSKDWRSIGGVTPVKYQNTCGACWIFSAVAAIEGSWFQETGQTISLSEQQVLDCCDCGNG